MWSWPRGRARRCARTSGRRSWRGGRALTVLSGVAELGGAEGAYIVPVEDLDAGVLDSLQKAGLWDEVKDNLDGPATGLSGAQQQRLRYAGGLVGRREVLLLDELNSALELIATTKVEQMIHEPKSSCKVVIVTHYLAQATRVSDNTAFFYLGKLVQFATTDTIFHHPAEKRTEKFVIGLFG